MDIQLATLSDILDFRPRELSNEEWSRLESLKDVVNLRRPLEEARLPGGWAGLRNKILAEAGDLLDIHLLDVMRWAWKKGLELEAYRDTKKIPARQNLQCFSDGTQNHIQPRAPCGHPDERQRSWQHTVRGEHRNCDQSPDP